jgi:nucleoid-associated protein YgaU
MTDDEKRIADMALSTATLASFAIPGAGAVVAGVIGTAQLLFDIFCPAAPVDPLSQPPTLLDLDNKLNDVVSKIDEQQWQVQISLLADSVLAQNDLFNMFWQSMSAVKLDKIIVDESDQGANDGGDYISDEPDTDLVDDLHTYFDLGKGQNVYLAMTTALKVLQNPGDKTTSASDKLHLRTQNTPLYCVVASTLIAFMKARVIWQWSHDKVLKWEAWLAYNNEWTNYQRPAYQKKYPVPPVSPLEAGEKEPKAAPDWNDWSTGGPPQEMIETVNKILLYVEGDGTAANPGLYTTMCKNWYTDRPQKIADRLSEISGPYAGGHQGGYIDRDPVSGGTSPLVRNDVLAQLHMDAKCGALIAYLWELWSEQYGLDDVDEDALIAFGETIKEWKEARASVRFTVHTVDTGETLSSIAKAAKGYKSPFYAVSIFDANRKDLTISDPVPGGPVLAIDRVVLTVGQVLTLPNKADLPYTFHQVAKGETLKTIAKAFYGNEQYDAAIFDANSTTGLQVMPFNFTGPFEEVERVALVDNQILKLPSKNDVGYTFYDAKLGDTLQSIALSTYGAERYDLAVYKANSRFLKVDDFKVQAQGVSPVDATLLGVGQTLTLWRKDDVGFVLYKLTAADIFPDTVAELFYGDSTLTTRLLGANEDWITAGNYFPVKIPGAGIVVRVPILGTNRDTNA